jgi:hypothetical protein
VSVSTDSPEPSTRRARPAANAHWTAWFIHFRFVAFLLILGVFAWVMFPNPLKRKLSFDAEQDQQRRTLFNGVKVWRALDEFRKTRGTAAAPYPAELGKLDELGITLDIGALLAVKRPFAGEWQYFPQAEAGNRQAPLLISPPLVVGKERRDLGIKQQVVMSVDGAIQLLTPEQARKLVEASSRVPAVRIAARVVE